MPEGGTTWLCRLGQKANDRRRARRAPAGLGVPSHSVEWYAQRIKALEAERDRLKAELSEAEERIGRLEESRPRRSTALIGY